MPITSYLSPLSSLVNKEKFPSIIQNINSIDTVLDSIFYENLIMVFGRQKESGFFSISLVFTTKVGIPFLTNDEFTILLNPNFSPGTGNYSTLQISASYRVDILKYKPLFTQAKFSGSPRSIFDLLIDILGLSQDELIDGTINSLIDTSDPTNTFITECNNKYNLSPPIILDSGLSDDLIRDLVLQIEGRNLDILAIIFDDYIFDIDSSKIKENTLKLFSLWIDEVSIKNLLNLFIPKIDILIPDITIGLEFPIAYLRQVNPLTNEWLTDPADGSFIKALLLVELGTFSYNSLSGFRFDTASGNVNFTASEITGTGLILSFGNAKFDFSSITNIPEADADGRPVDFMGVYIQDATIGFPAFWQHDATNSTGEIKGRNLLIGTGGISGTLALEAKTSGDPSPLLELKFGTSFTVSLDAFSVTFQQNSIINSNIRGTLTLPGFKQGQDEAKIPIDAAIGKDGDFKISSLLGQVLDPISIPEILDLYILALEVGGRDGKYYATITGEVNFTVNVPNISTDFPQRLPMKIRVWENGKIEFDKSVLILPRAISLKVGPVTLAVTALHFGSAELKHGNHIRQYNYIGFDGALNINPGGVGVRGNGVKLYYTTDDDDENGKPSHRFIRVDGIGIDLMIPGNAVSPDQAELFLKGYLAVKNKPQEESGPATTEYAGSIAFSINRAAIKGAGAMRYEPSVPSFLVDISAELSSPIVLGSTGLGLYGFRGLMANNYRLNKAEEDTWWKFYKKPQEGINFEKYTQDKGFSLGLGTILATVPDGGTSFSSKLLFLLGLPDVFLLSGQGDVMNKRVSYLDPDPPYSVMMSISRESIEAGFGVNYLVPKGSGVIMKTTGDIQMAYFFKNASAWYINVGKDFPEQERLRSVTFSLFESYAYLMISAQGIKFGEGKKFEFQKSYGPVGVSASLYRNTFARLSFKPVQLGGGVDVGGNAHVNVLKFKLGVSIFAYLGADAFKPFKISGGAKVALTLPKPFKNREVDVNFVWVFDDTRPTTPFKPIEAIDGKTPVKAINMLSGEDYTVNYAQTALPLDISWIDKTIPLDSYIDVDFEYSVKTELTQDSAIIQGEIVSPDYTPSIPPNKGLSEPVKHELKLKKVLIKAWDGSAWANYNVYEGVSAIKDIPDVQIELLSNPDYLKTFPQGFWQLKSKNKNTSLRILGQNMFSYLNSSAEGSMKLEYLGFKGGAVLCEEDKIQPSCINWEDVATDTEYVSDTIINYKGVTLKIIGSDGVVKTYSAYSLNKGLNFTTAEGIEIYFNEPQGYVKPSMSIFSPNKLQIEYYREVLEGYDANNIPVYIYSAIRTDIVEAVDITTYAGYDNPNTPVQKIKISIDRTSQSTSNPDYLFAGRTLIAHPPYFWQPYYGNGAPGMVVDEIMLIGRALTQNEQDNLRINNITGPNVIAKWQLNNDADDSSGNGYDGYFVSNGSGSPVATSDRNNNSNSSVSFGAGSGNSGPYLQHHMKVDYDDNLCIGANNFTIAAWVKLPAYDLNNKFFAPRAAIISNLIPDSGHSAHKGYYLEVVPQRNGIETTRFRYMNDDTNAFAVAEWIDSKNIVFDGQWHFISVSVNWDLGRCILNIDGKYVKESRVYRPPVTPVNNNAYLHQLCLLSEKESQYNAAIPPQSKLTSENTKMADGLTKLLQPIWRPNTNYAIEITTSDNVDGTGENESQISIGFKTAGPVGYFHDLDSRYTSLAGDEKDKYQLANLQHYINYNRSYPNAEGKLLSNKPIFYKQPNVHLYFNDAYANALYSEWDVYNGLPADEYDLELYVADPLNEQIGTNALQPVWVPGKTVLETEDMRVLNNLIANGQNCSGLIGPIERKAYNANYVLPDLKPSTLYTAIYHAVYNTEKVKVHQHVFATSKYATFKEQVESYLLGDNLTAIFTKAYDLSTSDITKATDIVTKNSSQDSVLVKEFADDFDRLLYGALNKLSPMEAATGTEFTIIKNTNNQKTTGILLRNPEPIFNPQLPDTDLQNSITVVNNLQAGGTDNAYTVLFSKDRSVIYLTNNGLDIPSGTMDITMRYMEYNGTGYVLKSPQIENEITVNINLS